MKPRGVDIAASVIIFVGAAYWTLVGIQLLVASNNATVQLFGAGDDLAVFGLLVLGIAAWCVVFGVQLLRVRKWARTAALITLSVLGVGVLLLALGAADDATRDDPFSNDQEVHDGLIGVGVLTLVGCGVVDLLLLIGRSQKARSTVSPYAAPYGAPAVYPPVPPAQPVQPVQASPQWDQARGAYVQWDPARQAWLQWSDVTREWRPIDT